MCAAGLLADHSPAYAPGTSSWQCFVPCHRLPFICHGPGGLPAWSAQTTASGLYFWLDNAVNVQLATPKSATITTTFPAAQVAQPFAGMLCML